MGRTNAELSIRVGKATLPISFTKGCLDRKNYRPATFTTADPTIQNMIEDSSLFGSVIVLYKVYDKGGIIDASDYNEPQTVAKPSAITAGPTEYPEVTTHEQAVTLLKSLGAKASSLVSTEAMQRYMKSHGVVFPNYSF